MESLRELYSRRRDVMLEALQEHFGDSARWTTPQGGLFVWATLDERIDTTDLLALARKSEGVAFVPGRAAYMDGRRGSSSMRLNFAGVPEQDIREGIRRIGRGVREQLGLLGTLTGSRHVADALGTRAPTSRPDAGCSPTQEQLADVVDAAPPRGRTAGAPPRRQMSARRRVAVLKGGRSLERSVSLRSGAQVQDALTGLGHEVVALDVGETLVPDLLERSADVAFVALHGREGEDGTVQGLLEALAIPYTGSGQAACMRATDKLLAKLLMREAGIPTPAFHALREESIKELGAAAALERIQARTSACRWWSSRPAAARRWGSSSPATPRSCRGRWWGRSPMTARSCWSATSAAATWRCRCSRAPAGSGRRWRCRSSRRFPARRSSTTTSRATRSG